MTTSPAPSRPRPASPSPRTPEPRPATTPAAGDAAAVVLARHADNPSAFLALNEQTRHFTVAGVDGLIAYRPAGRRHLVQLGGVVAAEPDADRLLQAFLDVARRSGRRVTAVQLQAHDTARYAAHGFRLEQIGASYAVDLSRFTVAGKRFVRLRNKVSRARRAGIEVLEVGADLPDSPELQGRLDAVDADWLRAKGSHAKPLSFMVGERGGAAAPLRRLFLARDEDRVLGYLSLSPVHGRRPGWLHDLSRRVPDAPPGVAELLTLTAVERLRAEGVGWLHLGLTPFTGLSAEHEVAGAGSPVARRVVRALAEHGARLYPAADQLAYKQKWAPDVLMPEYVGVHGGITPGTVWALLRLTGAL